MAFTWGGFFNVLDSGAKLASSAADIYGAIKAAEAADKQQEVQERELRRQAALNKAKAAREARIKRAQLLASGAGVAVTSSMSLGAIGIQSSLDAGLTELSERTQFNIDSLSARTEATKAEAVVEGIGALANTVKAADQFSSKLETVFAAEEIDNNFTDTI